MPTAEIAEAAGTDCFERMALDTLKEPDGFTEEGAVEEELANVEFNPGLDEVNV